MSNRHQHRSPAYNDLKAQLQKYETGIKDANRKVDLMLKQIGRLEEKRDTVIVKLKQGQQSRAPAVNGKAVAASSRYHPYNNNKKVGGSALHAPPNKSRYARERDIHGKFTAASASGGYGEALQKKRPTKPVDEADYDDYEDGNDINDYGGEPEEVPSYDNYM